jgi:hypothetical protein
MKAGRIIEDVSRDLNDQELGYEYTRWTQAQLMSYLREALLDAAPYVKDLFLEKVVVKVEPGGGWQKACTCDEILKIEGVSDADGRLLYSLQRLPDDDAYDWDGRRPGRCMNPSDWRGQGYAVSSVEDSEFRIYPPLPGGLSDTYVLVRCYGMPEDVDGDTDVPSELLAAVKQWMLWRALSVDSENNSAILELASRHRASYGDLLGRMIKRRQEEEAERERRDHPVRPVQKQTS